MFLKTLACSVVGVFEQLKTRFEDDESRLESSPGHPLTHLEQHGTDPGNAEVTSIGEKMHDTGSC